MKSKILIFVMTVILYSCTSDSSQDSLILPPDFDVVPDLNNKDSSKPKQKEVDSEEDDIEELRDLLLNGS